MKSEANIVDDDDFMLNNNNNNSRHSRPRLSMLQCEALHFALEIVVDCKINGNKKVYLKNPNIFF